MDREKSILLLCGCISECGQPSSNKWYIIHPMANSVEEFTALPTKLGEHGYGYGRTTGVIIGPYLYFVGGYNQNPPKNRRNRLMTNFIGRINIHNPADHGLDFELPFFCCSPTLVASGIYIFIFQHGYSRFSSCPKRRYNVLNDEYWGYVYDTQAKDGMFLNPPPSTFVDYGFPFFCMADGPKILVQLEQEMHIYDSIQMKWDISITRSTIDVFPEEDLCFSKLVSDGILFCLWYNSDREVKKPVLTAYHVEQGNLLFRLEVDSTGSGGGTISSFLVDIGDSKLCWIDATGEGFFSTVMMICYEPTPYIDILKKRKYEVPILEVACCFSADLSLEARKPATSKRVGSSPSLNRNVLKRGVGLQSVLYL